MSQKELQLLAANSRGFHFLCTKSYTYQGLMRSNCNVTQLVMTKPVQSAYGCCHLSNECYYSIGLTEEVELSCIDFL
jgi:hypothetical protein